MEKHVNCSVKANNYALITYGKQNWILLSPTNDSKENKNLDLPSRPNDLEGKTICLLDNHKPNASVALARIGELLKTRFKNINIFTYEKKKAAENAPYDWFLGIKCDLVIAAQCD